MCVRDASNKSPNEFPSPRCKTIATKSDIFLITDPLTNKCRIDLKNILIEVISIPNCTCRCELIEIV